MISSSKSNPPILTTPLCRDLLSNPRQHLSHYQIRDGLIFCGPQLYIPASDEIKSNLMREAHDSAVGGHVGMAKTMESLSRSYYWPKMAEDVKEYIRLMSLLALE